MTTEVAKNVTQVQSAPTVTIAQQLDPYRWTIFSLAVLVFVFYGPTVRFDFVNWDDTWYVVDNPQIKSWHPANLLEIATQVSIRNYAPVTTLSFLVEHSLWGLNPAGYHFTNCLLHAINTILVCVLVVQLTGDRRVGWLAAALFAVHPVHIESVAWISSRKGLLSGAFILASLIYWLRPERTARHEGLGIAFFALALLSKAITVVVPMVVLLYDLLVRRQSLAVALPRQMIPGLMALAVLFVTMSAQVTMLGGVRDHLVLSKLEILAVDAVILWRYMGMLVLPDDLCVLYNIPTSGIALAVTLAVIGWAVVGGLLYRSRRRHPMIAFAGCCWILFLLPVLNLVPLTTLMNDRYLYLPSIPMFALVSAAICRLADQCGSVQFVQRFGLRATVVGRAAVIAVVAVGVSFYGDLMVKRLPVWRDAASLWGHAMEHVPELAVVRYQWADSLHRTGHPQEAVAVLESALADCKPDEGDRKRIEQQIVDWQ